MYTLPVALITVRRSAEALVGSARPDAPVVPDVPRAEVAHLVATCCGVRPTALRRPSAAPPSDGPRLGVDEPSLRAS